MTAYLSFYDPPFAHDANDALWANLRDHALALGLDAPAMLDRSSPYRAIWHAPDLAFAQTCGLPFVTSLAGRVRLLATPVYDFAGCEGAQYSSVIVTRSDAAIDKLIDLRGSRLAFNARDSQSGYVALRHSVGALAGGSDFFSREIETGSHLASLRAVQEGRADVSACDCITFGLVARHRAEWLEGLRVIGRTATTPAPPFVTRGDATDAEVDLWQEALRRTFSDPRSAVARAFLGLRTIEFLPAAAYDAIAAMAKAVRGPAREVLS